MRTRVRLLAAAMVAALASGVLWGGAARAEDEATAELSSVGSRAFQQLGECLAPVDSTLNVLYVLDASSSLRDDTDTEGLRFAILAQSLRQLGSLAEARTINTAVASFDLGFDVRQPWQGVDSDSADELAAWALSEPQWWGEGQGTNWEAALEQGDALMRQAPGSQDSCNMLVWVTDGGINVDGDWQEINKNAAAMRAICATDPVTGEQLGRAAIVDSMRSSGTHLIGVLLQSEAYLESLLEQGGESARRAAVEASRQTYMRPITEGSAEVDTTGFTEGRGTVLDFSCGNSVLNEGQAAGALLLGTNPIALAYQLGSLSGRLAGAQPVAVSDGPPYSFAVPVGVNLIDAQIAGTDWTVTSPDGTVVATPSTLDTPGLTVIAGEGLSSVRVSGDAVSDGTWTIDVTDPPARPQVSLAALLEGTYAPVDMRVGETAALEFTFTDQFTGQPANPSEYAVEDYEVTANAGTTTAQLTCTDATDAIALTCEFTPEQVGTATVDAQVTIATADPTAPFTTEFTGTFDQAVLPAATFPQVSPDVVALSDLDGKRGTAAGQITVIGPEEGTGSVCFPDAGAIRIDSDVVDRSASYTFTSSGWSQCLALAPGEVVTVPIEVTNPVPATGSVQASFDVTLESEATEATYPQTVTLTFDTIREGTPPWWLLLALVLAGVGIPLGLLYLQSLAASRLSMKGLRVAAVPVRVNLRPQGASIERATATGDGALMTLDDWDYLPTSMDRPRSARVASGITLAAMTPRGPLSPLRAEARAPSGARVVSESGTVDAGRAAPVSLTPAGQWLLLAHDSDLAGIDPEDGDFPATLVAFLAGSADANEMNTELTSSLRASDGPLAWHGIITHLRQQRSAPDEPVEGTESTGSRTPTTDTTGGNEFDTLFEQTREPGPPANSGGPAPSPDSSPPPPRRGSRFDDDDPFADL